MNSVVKNSDDIAPLHHKKNIPEEAMLRRFSKTREFAKAEGRQEAHTAGTMFALGLALCCIPFPVCLAVGLTFVLASARPFFSGARNSATNLKGADAAKDVLKSLGRAALGAVFFLEIPIILVLEYAIKSQRTSNQAVKDFVEFTEQHRFYATYEAQQKYFKAIAIDSVDFS
jgi:hypothetical protein